MMYKKSFVKIMPHLHINQMDENQRITLKGKLYYALNLIILCSILNFT